jgi:hypothetical protein
VSYLKRTGPATFDRLRRLYRGLAMKAHPDISRRSHDQFVRLQIAYEEALTVLSRKRSESINMTQHGDSTPEQSQATARAAVLRSLYRYALKFNGREAEQVFSLLLQQSKRYRPETHEDLREYGSLFRNTYSTWRGDVTIYDAHGAWIAAIVELARYLSDGWSGYRNLMEQYIAELERKARSLEEHQETLLLRLAAWLTEEAHGPAVELIYE